MTDVNAKFVHDLSDEIAHKQFSASLNGFNPDEVDQYLNSILDSLKVIEDYLFSRQQEDELAAAAKPEPIPSPAPRPAPSTSNVEEVLTLAVQLKNNIIAEAQSKADRLLQEAELQAKDRLGALEDEEKRLQGSIDTLKETAARYRDSFEKLLQSQQEAFDQASELF